MLFSWYIYHAFISTLFTHIHHIYGPHGIKMVSVYFLMTLLLTHHLSDEYSGSLLCRFQHACSAIPYLNISNRRNSPESTLILSPVQKRPEHQALRMVYSQSSANIFVANQFNSTILYPFQNLRIRNSCKIGHPVQCVACKFYQFLIHIAHMANQEMTVFSKPGVAI